MTPQTQKAKGIMALVSNPPRGLTVNVLKLVKVWPHDPVGSYPFFARPCPMKPRHGYVESRIVSNAAEFEQVVAEVKASNEPDAEIVMMPYIPCQFSGVLTMGGVAYGPGNDGVTGGQNARAIPAQSPSRADLLHAMNLTTAGTLAEITGSPYLEFVETAGALEAVQLRNGPDVPLVSRYIPRNMTVLEIVVPTPEEIKELMAWEKRMITLKGRQGVVVHYPGGAMSSHVAVQAIEQTKDTDAPFAVYTSMEPPMIGDVLVPTVTIDPITQGQYEEFAAMLAHAITSLVLEGDGVRTQAIELAVAALHASPFWNGDRHLLVLRAVAIASLMRFASGAILGELRHWNGSAGPGGHGKGLRRTTPLDAVDAAGKLSREQVYERAFNIHMKHLSPRMGTAYRDFMTKGWGSSFGGKNWGGCTKQTILLFNAVSDYLKAPGSETWAAIMSAWNGTVNVFHNTGKFLNKFISGSVMDRLAKLPVLGLLSTLVGDLVVHDEDFGLHRNVQRVAEDIRVVVPAPVKKAPVVIVPILTKAIYQTMQFEARWLTKGAMYIYIQVKLPKAVDKPYGTSWTSKVSPWLRNMLGSLHYDGTSLTGSTTAYGKGVVRMVQGVWVLEITQNGMQVPFNPATLVQALESTGPKAEDSDSEEDVTF